MGKTVVLGITGGIAAYKSAELVSRMRKAGLEVYCILTAHGAEFITPLTLETLSAHPVVTDMFRREQPWEVEHISLAKRADVFVIAPATANIIAKMANGIADDMLSTTVMATKAPIVMAPAMHTNMYQHPATRKNLRILEERGCRIVGPDSGSLACGDEGLGRMSQPEEIFKTVEALLQPRGMEGLRVLVTAGPTREPIDPVRYISNRSSGKMGYAIAREALERGAEVTLVTGPVSIAPPVGAKVVRVETTGEMYEACLAFFPQADICIKAAAPADFRPTERAGQKIKKMPGQLPRVDLVENPDIAAELGRIKKSGQTLVIFAAETQDLLTHAREKLEKKGADLMVANDVSRKDAGFDADTNAVTLMTREETWELPLMLKTHVAAALLDAVLAVRGR